MSEIDPSRRRLQREAILFGALFGGGLLLLPVAIYLVGKAVFGSYGGGDFFDFFVALHARLWRGDPAVVFLMLSPYLLVQLLRLTFRAVRSQAPRGSATRDGPDAGRV